MVKSTVSLVAASLLIVCGIQASFGAENESDRQCWWTGPRCIRSCAGRRDGNYQSCNGCHVFASCSNGKMYNDRPCAPSKPQLNWDDIYKVCNYTSTTCRCYSEKTKDHPTSDISDKSTDVSSLKQSESEAPPQCHSTGYRCIRSCQGLPDGDYQSCHSCHVYASCTNGSMIDDRQCAPAQPPLNWDDRAKRCLHKSLTCRCYNGEDTKKEDPEIEKPSEETSKELEGNKRPECRTTGWGCIRSCQGLPDGDYQSCHSCHVYASCTNGALIDDRPCAPAQPPLNWDDMAKKCLYRSWTCKCSKAEAQDFQETPVSSEVKVVESTKDSEPECKTTGWKCIRSCDGLKDGNYQSCNTCQGFASCSNGQLIDNRPCPSGLVWDDIVKNCIGISTTCYCYKSLVTEMPVSSEVQVVQQLPDDSKLECSWTGERCIINCDGRPNDNYQSCKTCRGYASCWYGQFSDNIPCPSGFWDDNVKNCVERSTTCFCSPVTDLEAPPECKSTGWRCIRSCDGLPDGDYQSCNTCHGYVTCANGKTYDNRPCPSGLVWDDNENKCLASSSTCTCINSIQTVNKDSVEIHTTDPRCRTTGLHCIRDCYGLPDGDYQSCHGCSVYASCTNGQLIDDRPCAPASPPLQWDDYTKRCEYKSRTCRCYRDSLIKQTSETAWKLLTKSSKITKL